MMYSFFIKGYIIYRNNHQKEHNIVERASLKRKLGYLPKEFLTLWLVLSYESLLSR